MDQEKTKEISPINDLPEELILKIAEYLDKKELFLFRTTSKKNKAIAEKTEYFWRQRCLNAGLNEELWTFFDRHGFKSYKELFLNRNQYEVIYIEVDKDELSGLSNNDKSYWNKKGSFEASAYFYKQIPSYPKIDKAYYIALTKIKNLHKGYTHKAEPDNELGFLCYLPYYLRKHSCNSKTGEFSNYLISPCEEVLGSVDTKTSTTQCNPYFMLKEKDCAPNTLSVYKDHEEAGKPLWGKKTTRTRNEVAAQQIFFLEGVKARNAFCNEHPDALPPKNTQEDIEKTEDSPLVTLSNFISGIFRQNK